MMTPTIHPPHLIVRADATAASKVVAEMICSAVHANPEIVLGLATGSSPIEAYHFLIAMYKAAEIDFSEATSFNLDEYIGLPAKHPQSFRYFMQQHLFDHVNFAAGRVFLPDGCAKDPVLFAKDYEKKIDQLGGIDLQLLGIGHNGHIAFNEPGSTRDSLTRVVELSDLTIEKNSRFFDSADEVPKTAITMGIGTILRSKEIVLLATGKDKAAAIREMLAPPPRPEIPASWLLTHGKTTLVLDHEAASEL